VFTGTGGKPAPVLVCRVGDEDERPRSGGPGQVLMKSYTPECAKIEQFAATLAPLNTYLLCI